MQRLVRLLIPISVGDVISQHKFPPEYIDSLRHSERKSASQSRCDLVIRLRSGHVQILEFLASSSEKDTVNHIEKTMRYQHALHAHSFLVIHFVQYSVDSRAIMTSLHTHPHLVYCIHSPSWHQCTVWSNGETRFLTSLFFPISLSSLYNENQTEQNNTIFIFHFLVAFLFFL